MAEKQLGIAKADKQAEFDSIMALTNPTVKKYYLHKFAEDCDSAAVHLKGASLPGQKYYVILPVTSLSEKKYTLLVIQTAVSLHSFVIRMEEHSKFRYVL